MTATIGMIAPGEMGAAVAAAVTADDVRLVWASHGRSQASRRRADAAGVEDVGDTTDLVRTSEVILSICPPHAAVEVADGVAARGFDGCYVDANAVAALFTSGPLAALVLDGAPPAASALKAAYAGWTKGSAAMLLTVRALAAAEGVEDELLAEWSRSAPEFVRRSEGAATSGAMKGWRWIGEMDEIAAALGDTGLPDGFHLAAVEVFRRLVPLRGTDDDMTAVAGAVQALLHPKEPE